jgi:hypothetical protein
MDKKEITSLTRTAVIVRRLIRIGFYGIIILVVGRMILVTGLKIYRGLFPAPLPPPTVAFGVLPTLPFPEKDIPEDLTLTLETPTGELPVLPEQMNVYLMPSIKSVLSSSDKARIMATNLYFDPQEEKISDSIYRFRSSKVPSKIEINIITGVFSISYDLAADSSPLSKKPPDSETSEALVRSYLSKGGTLPEDLDGPVVPVFLMADQQQLVPAPSLSEADVVKINMFRRSYNDYPSLTSNPEEANVWLMVSGDSQREKQIIAAEFHYFPIDEEKVSTYPIKTALTAWEDLQNGKGYIADFGVNENNITVRRIYLAYYDPGVPTEFYQPIIVFEGDKGFAAYVPATTSDYYTAEPPPAD